MFGASGNKPNALISVPDPYFFMTHGFAAIRDFAERNGVPWSHRSSRLRWRGDITGTGRVDLSEGSATDPTVVARLRMVMISRSVPDMDACFASCSDKPWAEEALRAGGYYGEYVPEKDWGNDKFAIDIDGNSNTWSNLIVRMHLGCCVLKIDSQFGYRQWYYDRLHPWEHFIPVSADMSDLAEKLEWARTHDGEAEKIARNGQEFARSMTFESETLAAVEIITNAVRQGRRPD